MAEHKLVTHEPNRGYFIAPQSAIAVLPEAQVDPVESAYLLLAEERLDGRVPDVVTSAAIRDRYKLTLGQVNTLLSRVVKEGWLERRAGYGWQFTTMLNDTDALVQTYRFRMALEPAALLEPGYRLDAGLAEECRSVEERMLAGALETMSFEQLYDRGVRFHETIVAASNNPFYLDALRRINNIRRLLAYRSFSTRDRYYGQARDHLEILDLLENGRQVEAAERLRKHLGNVIHNLGSVWKILDR